MIYNLTGKDSKNAKSKDQLDQLNQRLVFDLNRNSDRRFSRRATHFRFMDKTTVTGEEKHDN